MSRSRSDDVLMIDAGDAHGAFDRLRAQMLDAVERKRGRVLVDLSGVDPIDGAMLALLVRASAHLGSSARIAVVTSAEAAAQLAEWRLDTLWPIATDRAAAMQVLLK